METEFIEKDKAFKTIGTESDKSGKSKVTVVNKNVQTITKSSCEEIAKRGFDIGENGKCHINRDNTSNKNTIANQKRLLETNGDKHTNVKQGCVKQCEKINKNAVLRKSQSCVEIIAFKEKTIPHSESFSGNSNPSSILESDGENCQTKANSKSSSIEKEKEEREEAKHQKLPQNTKQQPQPFNDQQDVQHEKHIRQHQEHIQISTATSVLTSTTNVIKSTTTAGFPVTNEKSKQQQLTGQHLMLTLLVQQVSEKDTESIQANNTPSPFTTMTPKNYSKWITEAWKDIEVDQFDDGNESTNLTEIKESTTNTSVKASIVQTGLSHGLETDSKSTIITSSKQTDFKTSKSNDSSIGKPLVGNTSSRSAAAPLPSAAPPKSAAAAPNSAETPKSTVTPKSAAPSPNSAAPPQSAAAPKSTLTPKSAAAAPKSTVTPNSAAPPPNSAAQSPNSAAPSKSTTAPPSVAPPKLTPAAAVSIAPDTVSAAPTSTAESLPPKNLQIASQQTGKMSLSDSFSSPDVDYISVHSSSSFPHQSSSSPPLTSPSEIPVLSTDFTIYERISEESMTSSTPSAIVPSTSCSARTYSNRRNRKDFIILSADADQEEVEKFRDHFLKDIGVHDLTVDLFNEIDGGQTAMLSLETLHDRYIFILVFGTPNFAKDKVFSFLSEIILTSGLQDANGKEDRVIPVWQNKHCKRSIYQLQIIKGFEYFHYLASPKSLAASSYLKCVKCTVLEGRKKFP